MNNAVLVIFLIFLGMMPQSFSQESMNFTSQIKEIRMDISELTIAISNLKNDSRLSDENTQTKLSSISNDLFVLQQIIEINERNIDKIKKDIENFNHQIDEIKNTNVECVEKDFECEKIIQKLDQVNDSLQEIKGVIFGNSLSNLVIISISLVVAGVAITVAIVTTKTAIGQLVQTSKEQKHRLRPILVREEYFDFEKDGLKRPHKVEESKILFRIKNIGPLPTTKVLMRWYVAIIQNGKYDFLRSSDEDYPVEGRPLPNLESNESYSIDLFINHAHYDYIHTKTNCVFGVLLEYYHENQKYEYRMDGYFDHGGDLMLLSLEEMEKMITLMMKNI